MTSRDVIVALQRTKSRRGVVFSCARAVDLFLAVAWLIYLVLALGGCSMDTSGLSTSLRGEIAVDGGSDETDSLPSGQSDAGSGSVVQDADVSETAISVSPDTGSSDAFDSLPANSVDSGLDGGTQVSLACPIDPTRSLSPCDRTYALCRYGSTYITNCTAEGYLCVAKCPT